MKLTQDEYRVAQGLITRRMHEIKKENGVGFPEAHKLASSELAELFSTSREELESAMAKVRYGFWRGKATTEKHTRAKPKSYAKKPRVKLERVSVAHNDAVASPADKKAEEAGNLKDMVETAMDVASLRVMAKMVITMAEQLLDGLSKFTGK